MHSGIIDEILEVEDNAFSIVDNAEKEAREIIFKAQEDKRNYVQSRLEAKRRENDAAIEEAESLLKEHLAIYEEKKEEIEKSAASVDPDVLEHASARIVEVLLGV